MANMRYQPQGRAQLDRANPLTKGITHSWGVNIRGQSALYDAAGRADGRFGAGLGGTSGNSWQLGPAGYFVSFNDGGTGTVDSVALAVGDAAGSGSPGANAFSFVARIRLGSLTSTSQALYGSDASGGIEIRVGSTGAIELLKQAVAGIGTSSGTVAAGVDVDVGVAYDGSVVQFYINGSPAGSANNPQTFVVATQCYLGFANVGGGGTRERLSNGSRLYKADIWNRALSPSEFAAWNKNPWQVFEAPDEDDYLVTAAAPASISGTLAATLAAPTMSSTGLVALPGTLAATLAAPTFAASGIAATPPQGTFAATLAAPVMSASGIATNYAQLAATMAAPTMTATGTAAPHATGTLTFTMPAPTMSAFGFLGATAPAAPVRPYRWRILRRHFVVN